MPMNYASGGMFYDPNSTYGRTHPGRYDQTQLGQFYLNDIAPEAAFTRRLAELGRGGMDRVGQRSSSLYGQAARGYSAAQGTNQDLQWTNYLKGIDFDTMEAQMSSSARGEDPAKMAGGLRWLQR